MRPKTKLQREMEKSWRMSRPEWRDWVATWTVSASVQADGTVHAYVCHFDKDDRRPRTERLSDRTSDPRDQLSILNALVRAVQEARDDAQPGVW